jgi:DNA polymerase-1
MNTSAIFGFVISLEDVLKREKPTHIAVVFDPPGKTFRHEAFELYKAQRMKTPEDIRKSIPYIKQIVDAYGITMFEVEGYEADDVIGTLAKMAQNQDFDVFMITPDKDYAQLVDEHIFQYKPRFGAAGFDILGVEEIKAKYELENTLQIIDFLGLMGDVSDNIPGCPGVGEKTAAKLIKEFGSIENLLQNSDKLTGSLKEKVVQNSQQITFSKFLATIKIDVPLDFDIKKIERRTPDFDKLSTIFNELEFKNLLNRVLQNSFPSEQKKESGLIQGSLFDDEQPSFFSNSDKNWYEEGKNMRNTEHQYFLVQTEEEINSLIEKLKSQKEFCFDTETTSLNTFDAEIVGLSFSFEKHKAYFVPVPENRILAAETVRKFKEIFEDENIGKTGQNTKYDIMVLQNYGIDVKGKLFDTMVAHYLLQPELRHNMDYMAEVFLNYKTMHYEELFK